MYEFNNLIRACFISMITSVASDYYDKFNIQDKIKHPNKDIYIQNILIVAESTITSIIENIWKDSNSKIYGIPMSFYYVFLNFSYGISILGAVLYSVFTLFNIDISNIFLTKISIVLLSISYIICGIISMYIWLYSEYWIIESGQNENISDTSRKSLILMFNIIK